LLRNAYNSLPDKDSVIIIKEWYLNNEKTGPIHSTSTSNLFGANYIIWTSALIAAAAGVASFLILKNPKYKDSEKGIDNRKNYDRYY
jgi:hypothetical protein